MVEEGGAHLEHRVVGCVEGGHPIDVVALGNPSLDVPAVGFFGGVHGLERIGVRVRDRLPAQPGRCACTGT